MSLPRRLSLDVVPSQHRLAVRSSLLSTKVMLHWQSREQSPEMKQLSSFQVHGVIFSWESKKSRSPPDHKNLNEVDFVVLVPVPVFQLSYADEDLHVERRLTVELTENGEMSMLEVLYDKTKNTITEVKSSLTKVSNEATPFYKTLELDPTHVVKVGQRTVTVKSRKPNCCTKCGNRSKGHLGPTGKFCNMNKVQLIFDFWRTSSKLVRCITSSGR